MPEPQTPVKTNWCQKCAQPTSRGISHPCTPAIRKRNIVSLIEQHGQKETEQILGMGLEDIVDNGKNGVIELASITGNKKKMKVTIGEKKEEGASMSACGKGSEEKVEGVGSLDG